MEYKARPYQQACIDYIVNNDAAGLFLDMGLGKTVITLTAIKEIKKIAVLPFKTLIIAPLKVAELTWGAEIAKWDHLQDLRCSLVLGSEANRRAALDQDADIYIINRDNVTWLVNLLGHNWPFAVVVVDESSSFKNYKAKRTKALMSVRSQIAKIVILTGTPAPQGLEDLWSQIYLLDQGKRLGRTITSFRDHFFSSSRAPWGSFVYTPFPTAKADIAGLISDICFSMSAADYLDLPPMIEQDIPVKLSQKALESYEELSKTKVLEFLEENEDLVEVDAASAGVLVNKLLQLAGGAIYDSDQAWHSIHNDKIQALGETLEALHGAPTIIFYNYKHEKERIIKLLEENKIEYRTLASNQEKLLWDAGKIPVLLLHPTSCAYGLNLQDGGHNIIWYSLTWNLEHYIQANARLHRSGQDGPVVVHRLLAAGTVDEDVAHTLDLKGEGLEYLLGKIKAKLRAAKTSSR